MFSSGSTGIFQIKHVRRRYQVLIFVMLSSLFCGLGFGQRALPVDELAELSPDSLFEKCINTTYDGDTPRGVAAGVHVVIDGLKPATDVECSLSLVGHPVQAYTLYRLIDVPVEQNVGLGGWTERSNGKENPYVIRNAPFRVYEVLMPAAGGIACDDQGQLVLRVEVPIDAKADAGVRDYVITVKAAKWQRDLHWKLRVHKTVVRSLSQQVLGYSNWFSTSKIASWHGLEQWSEPFWKMLEQYADLMARGRQNTFMIRWPEFITVESHNQVRVDEARLKRYIRLFLERGFTRIESGPLALHHNNDWNSDKLDTSFTHSDVNSPEGRQEIATVLTAIRGTLERLTLPATIQVLQHLADEPTDVNAENYKLLAQQVRKLFPGVRIFEATLSSKLTGAVDYWCPQVQVYQQKRDFFEARRKAGDSIWVYTCLSPGGKWLNRTLDQERLRQVYLGWSLVKYDLGGFLHWGLNQYREDPYKQSVVKGSGTPNDDYYLPAGDTHVIYPGPTGPLSGQRFEAHRIGMEDADLLAQLKERLSRRADAIIGKVFHSYNDYSLKLDEYRAARRELLEAFNEVK